MEQIEQQFPPGTILTPAKARELILKQKHVSASEAAAAVSHSLAGRARRHLLAGLRDLPKNAGGAFAGDDDAARSREDDASAGSSAWLSAPSTELLVALGFRVMVLSGTDFGAEMEPLLFSK